MAEFPEVTKKLEDAIKNLAEELSRIRSGRVTTALIEDISVDYYGARQPVKTLGTIGSLDARTLVVEPWDKNALEPIANAITKSPQGVQGIVDGNRVRINFPPLSKERRDEFIRFAGKKAEETRVRLRQVRDDELRELKKDEKNGKIGKDDFFRAKDRFEKMFKDYFDKIDSIKEAKEKELSS